MPADPRGSVYHRSPFWSCLAIPPGVVPVCHPQVRRSGGFELSKIKVNIHSLLLVSTDLRGVTTRPERVGTRFFKIPRTGVVRCRYFPGQNALRTDWSFGIFFARRRRNAVFCGLLAVRAERFLRWRAGTGGGRSGGRTGPERARRGGAARLEPGPAGRGVAFAQPGTRRYALTVCRRVARMSAAAAAMFTTSAIQPTASDCSTRSRGAVQSRS
jgi:hypothetical protein